MKIIFQSIVNTYSIKKIVFCFSISIAIPVLSISQTSSVAMELALKYFERNNFEEAINVCERIIFFEEHNNVMAAAYLLKGNAQMRQNKFEEARSSFVKVNQFLPLPDSMAIEGEFGKILCNIMCNDPHFAMVNILDMKYELTEYFQKKKKFFSAVVNFKIKNYAASEKEFMEILGNADTVLVREIFKEIILAEKKIKPKTAKILSMILPGSGQLYIGDFKNAAKSFLLTGAILGAAIHLGLAYTILDAYLFTANWFFRYYRGGFLKAELLAEKKLKGVVDSKFNHLIDLTGNFVFSH